MAKNKLNILVDICRNIIPFDVVSIKYEQIFFPSFLVIATIFLEVELAFRSS